MLCGLNEQGKLMCDIYFPDKEYSSVKMRIGNEFELNFEGIDKTNSFYWVRKFTLTNLKIQSTPRTVYQYHVIFLIYSAC
jgi:protein tyrosine phosphatase